MGCATSKQAVSVTPAADHSGVLRKNASSIGSGRGLLEVDKKVGRKNSKRSQSALSGPELGEPETGGSLGSACCESVSFRLGNLHKYVEGEQVAAGWPAWLSAVAGEAIQGWVPLRAESFEKLEKENLCFLVVPCSVLSTRGQIGQGTYSSVFRARDLETGKIVALKKVRFDNFEPESVRFMAREITILRRLDHPNVVKLEGLIASRLSSSIYLVFEYMEHDLTGLLACPDIKFSEPQIKCYMKQLLSAVQHFHSRGIMHRDIKGSNILINNEGILKLADFGLANFCTNKHKQPLTSRVVTLWYRPPELLLGATDYGVSVDLWSVGCVFAEIFLGSPILQGRTEVEQLHKIFKLCGSPPEEYWKKSKLPHATMFKPQQPYPSYLLDTFKGLPTHAVNLIQNLLSVEPNKRWSASSALVSEYFMTEPYACDPSTLPVYPPNKEIDAKGREETLRKKTSGRTRALETRRNTRKSTAIRKLAPAEDLSEKPDGANKISTNITDALKERDAVPANENEPQKDIAEETCHVKNASQGDIPLSGPLQVSGSSGFAWVKRRGDEASLRSLSRSSSKGLLNGVEGSAAITSRGNLDSRRHENVDVLNGLRLDSRRHDSFEIVKPALFKQWSQLDRPDSFDASDEYHSQELTLAIYQREEMASSRNKLGYQDQGEQMEYSGPLLSQAHRVDELLKRHDRQIRQAVRRSWFQRVSGKKNKK